MVLDRIAGIESDPLELRDLPDPQPGPGQVRVKVRCCGLCRTDLHVIEGDLPEQDLPIVPGHQIVGIVDRLGAGCSRFAEGDRVGVAWLRHTCGSCDFCRTGRENLCADQRFTGYHADGGYAEYAVVDEAFAYAMPRAFDDSHAAPLLCAGIVGYRALRRANLPDGGTLAIYGFGSSAHIIAQIVLHRGCDLQVVTRGEDHQRLARQMGASWAGDQAKDMPRDADSAILFAPVGHLVPPALTRLRKGGTLSIAGIYLSPIPELDYEKHVFHERDIRSVTANTREDGRALLAEAAEIPIRPEVTTYPLVETNRALRDLKADRLSGTGVIVVSEG
jgi:propanol-preferring alcohol dehydrogenase